MLYRNYISIVRRNYDKIQDKGRFIGSIIYLVIGLVILIFMLIWGTTFFYNSAPKDVTNWKRILWCLVWGCWGFSYTALQQSKVSHNDPAWKSYISKYLVAILFVASLVFSILHLSDKTSNYIFYFLSAPITFILSFNIDRSIGDTINILKTILGKS